MFMSISHKRDRVIRGGRNRAVRPKSFKTEELAKKWASANKIEKYKIVTVRHGLSKKLRLVAE